MSVRSVLLCVLFCFRSVLGLFVGLSCSVLFGLSVCVCPLDLGPRVVNSVGNVTRMCENQATQDIEHRALAPRSLGQQGVHERRGRSTAQCTLSSQLTSRGGAGRGGGQRARGRHGGWQQPAGSLQALLAALINCAQ